MRLVTIPLRHVCTDTVEQVWRMPPIRALGEERGRGLVVKESDPWIDIPENPHKSKGHEESAREAGWIMNPSPPVGSHACPNNNPPPLSW